MDEVQRTKADSGAVAREADLEPTYTDKAGQVYKKRILTGDRTTGKLHLGHYVGSLRSRIKYQGVYDTFILMADVQALTTHWDKPEILKQSVMDVALDYMAIGLNPYTGGDDDQTKAKIVVQSHVPSIAELTVLYGLVVPMRLIVDNPTTKSEAEQHGFRLNPDAERNPAFLLSAGTADEMHPLIQAKKLLPALRENFPELGEISTEAIIEAGWEIIKNPQSHLDMFEEAQHPWGLDPWEAAIKGEVSVLRMFRVSLGQHARERGYKAMTYGFLGYPVSQAADITFVNAHLVPVGEDQVPHVELTREIVRRMNKQYGGRRRILVEPQALIGGSTIKGLDGNAKMSKSLGNAVYLSDSDDEIWSKVKKGVTDPQRIRRDDPGRPEICNIFAYHQQFNAETEPAISEAGLDVPDVEETAKLCRSAGIGCVECKKNLMAKLSAMLEPMRERRAAWEQRPADLLDVLKEGTRRGNEEGNETVARVKSAMHVDYWK